ncbi:hypothetical protein [Sphingomonas bacterium]|uniref:hypothetical protein n=1 Tax=Sphingomonas bacterium TaxID=1895847 RepID=UPI001574F2F0|nr:hypothetical protein [Sphingomonas bacterium]
MRLRTIALTAMIACGAQAQPPPGQAREFDRILAGRRAEAPVRCIQPDLSARPILLDGRAIAYFRAGKVYVNRFEQRCPQLIQTRTLITTGVQGRLCRHDPVRVVDLSGGGGVGYGFCTFGDFVPYAKAK